MKRKRTLKVVPPDAGVDLKGFLGRTPAAIDSRIISKAIRDKKIMITGAGGTIGLELVSQVLGFKPSAMMLFERDETRLFYAKEYLKESGIHNASIQPVIGDILDKDSIERALEDFRPDIVFHAAAYKHVPLGEENRKSFIVNNIFGTVNLVHACDNSNIGKLVFISTDKAVEPVSVMGVTKRICEEFIRSFSKISKVSFVIVRFGNVLGSSGSVIQIFEEQAKNNKPLTLSSRNIKRFFMTLEEAAILSLEAASIGDNADIYVLDMGVPIKLFELAQYMLNSSQSSSSITDTGIRRGDKIEERLYSDEEEVISNTGYDKLLLLKSKNQPIEYKKFASWLKRIKSVLRNSASTEKEETEKLFKEIVPDYQPFEEYMRKMRSLKKL